MTAISSTPCADEPAIPASGQPDGSGIRDDFPRKVEDIVDAKRGIGERIKQARVQAGLAQVEVTEHCGVSRSAASIGSLDRASGAKGFVEYARVVGVSVEWPITGERIAASERTST